MRNACLNHSSTVSQFSLRYTLYTAQHKSLVLLCRTETLYMKLNILFMFKMFIIYILPSFPNAKCSHGVSFNWLVNEFDWQATSQTKKCYKKKMERNILRINNSDCLIGKTRIEGILSIGLDGTGSIKSCICRLGDRSFHLNWYISTKVSI